VGCALPSGLALFLTFNRVRYLFSCRVNVACCPGIVGPYHFLPVCVNGLVVTRSPVICISGN